MKWMLLAFFALTSVLLFTYVLQVLFLSDKRMNKRMKRYLTQQGKKNLGRKRLDVLAQWRVWKQHLRQRMRKKKNSRKLEQKLERSGLPLTPEEFVLFRWIFVLLCAGLLFFISGQLLFAVLGAGIGYVLPNLWLYKKQRERLQKLNEALPDLIAALIGSLRAGFSLPQALQTASEELESPMREELSSVLREMQFGAPIEEVLHDLQERMPSEDLDLMIQAIVIQRQVGGNLAVILEKIVETIRERMRIQRQITTLTAQGKLSGMIIGALPVVLGIVIYFIEPDYIGTLFTHPLGLVMMVCGVISSVIGFLVIRKITTIEV